MSGVGAATYMYASNQISYTPIDSSFTANNVNEALNQLYNIINNMINIPLNKFFYDKTTGLEDSNSLKRYIKENNNYYGCNANDVKTSDTVASVTVSNLVAYSSMLAGNLTVGKAGFANKSLILGSGTDNISNRGTGRDFTMVINVTVYLGNSGETPYVTKDYNVTITRQNGIVNFNYPVTYFMRGNSNLAMISNITLVSFQYN